MEEGCYVQKSAVNHLRLVMIDNKIVQLSQAQYRARCNSAAAERRAKSGNKRFTPKRTSSD